MIVVADAFDKALFEKLVEMGDQHLPLTVYSQNPLGQDQLLPLLPKVQGLVVRSATRVTGEMLSCAPQLKLVIRAGEGTDNIDKEACQKRGVKVANTPGANNNSAAEHTIALMMTLLRKTAWAHAHLCQEGGWDKGRFVGRELTGKTVGIVGFGRVGRLVAKRLAGFEAEILFYDPIVPPIPPYRKEDDIQKLFSSSDIVTLHVPLMPQTRNLVGDGLLNGMKPGAVLINASRGGIVDEEALIRALKGPLAGAAFDVFATEPLEARSPLRTLDNLIVTPHLGASTEEAQRRVGEMAIHQLREFFLKGRLLNEVSI